MTPYQPMGDIDFTLIINIIHSHSRCIAYPIDMIPVQYIIRINGGHSQVIDQTWNSGTIIPFRQETSCLLTITMYF